MGNAEIEPATKEDIDQFFEQEGFAINESINIPKFKEGISDISRYVAFQLALEKEWTKKKIDLSKLELDKKQARKGIPYSRRREAILHHFELEPSKGKITYDALMQSTPLEEIEIAQEDQPSKPFLHTTFLNGKGMKNLETIVHLINKETMIEYSPVFINSIALLLLYFPLEEGYCVASKMVKISSEMLGDPKLKNRLRWYFTFSKQDYFKLLGTFLMGYIDTTKFKKRSVLIRLQQIGYDINELLDEMFKYMFTSFLRIDIVLDVFTIYLIEGFKVLFRFAYSTMKVHKPIIKGVDNPKELRDTFQKVTYDKTDWNSLHEWAFHYRLTSKHHNINKTKVVELDVDQEEYKIISDFLPADANCPSEILSLKQFYRLWMMLPQYCQVRVPELLYSTSNDGYLLSTLYRNGKPYQEKVSVKFMFLIIKTIDGDIFGAFLDTVIVQSVSYYIGSDESFLFAFNQDRRAVYYSEKANNQYCVGGKDYIQIGGGGEGPAIRLNESLQEGQTYKCETFNNEPLTNSGDTFFEVAAVEAIMI